MLRRHYEGTTTMGGRPLGPGVVVGRELAARCLALLGDAIVVGLDWLFSTAGRNSLGLGRAGDGRPDWSAALRTTDAGGDHNCGGGWAGGARAMDARWAVALKRRSEPSPLDARRPPCAKLTSREAGASAHTHTHNAPESEGYSELPR